MKFRIALSLAMVLVSAIAAFSQSPAPAKPASTVKLPTAQEVLDKYVKAIGGRDAILKIKSWKSSGTVELAPMGVKGTVETISAAPGRSLTRMNLAGLGEFVEGFDGTIAWSVNPIQGNREKSGTELAQTKLTSIFNRE